MKRIQVKFSIARYYMHTQRGPFILKGKICPVSPLNLSVTPHLKKQGSSENDGRSDVYDRSEFKVISNCSYNNCCRTNCSHFYLYLPEHT